MNSASDHQVAKVLILCSESLSQESVESYLADTTIAWDVCNGFSAVETKLKSDNYAVVVSAPAGDSSEQQLLDRLKANYSELEFVHYIPTTAIQSAGHSQTGRTNSLMFVVTDLSHLKATLELAIKHQSMKNELFALRGQIAMSYGFDNIVGLTDQIQEVKRTLSKVAETDITILLTGPEGSGRTLIAHSLHHHSRRRHEKLITYDCRKSAEAQQVFQLFGSNNDTDTPGESAIEQADGGTLYIKDVEMLSLPHQRQLATFLSTMSIQTGSTGENIKVDIRLLLSASEDLESAVKAGTFSQELWHQINVIPINLPSMAERIDDLELLVEYTLRRITSRSESPTLTVSPSALETLRNHDWPGQVKELVSVLTRAAAVCRNSQIEAHDLGSLAPSVGIRNRVDNVGISNLGIARGKLAENQKDLIVKALNENDWNFTHTSQELGIGRTTLWRKVKKYNLKREAEKNTV